MAIGLTHLGEAIVQRLIEERPRRFLDLCGLPPSSAVAGKVLREVKLRPYAGKSFDGASRIDLVVPLSATEAMPVEVKLGETRLSKTRIDTEWLSGCRPSHDGRRWAGNMMSVLDRRFPEGTPEQPLTVEAEGVQYSLTPEWCVVIRRRTLKDWAGERCPAFNRARIVDFDALASNAGPAEFNRLVQELLAFPYYETWISQA